MELPNPNEPAYKQGLEAARINATNLVSRSRDYLIPLTRAELTGQILDEQELRRLKQVNQAAWVRALADRSQCIQGLVANVIGAKYLAQLRQGLNECPYDIRYGDDADRRGAKQWQYGYKQFLESVSK